MAELAECLPREPQLGEDRVHASNSSNLEEQEGHPWLHNKFKSILDYVCVTLSQKIRP